MSDDATPAKVRLTDGLGPLLEDALRRAYYYTETGAWRGPLTEEQDRWRAVAKVAAEQDVAAEREACADYVLRHAMACPPDSATRATLESVSAVLRLYGPNAQVQRPTAPAGGRAATQG